MTGKTSPRVAYLHKLWRSYAHRESSEIPPDELDQIIELYLGKNRVRNGECREDVLFLKGFYEVQIDHFPAGRMREELKKIQTKLMKALESLDETGQSPEHEAALTYLSMDFPQLQETVDLLEALVRQAEDTGQNLGRVTGGGIADLQKRNFAKYCWVCLKIWREEKTTKEILQSFAENMWKSFSGGAEENFTNAVNDLYPKLRRNPNLPFGIVNPGEKS